MAYTIRAVEYFYVNVHDELGAAYRVLSQLAKRGVNLLAFTAIPTGPTLAQFALFPEDPNKLVVEARSASLPLDGPHHAFLVQATTSSVPSRASTNASSRRPWTSTRRRA